MKATEIIPIKKEFLFITRMVIAMTVSAAIALVILYLFLSKPVDAAYKDAFQTISGVFKKMNVYVIAAVLIQLIFSSVVVIGIALFYSHKIAGPMYRLKMVLHRYMDGEAVEKVCFRQTDFIPGVSQMFTGFFKYLGERRKLLEEAEGLAERIEREQGKEKEELLKQLEAKVKELEGKG